MYQLGYFASVINVGQIIYIKNSDGSISEGMVTRINFERDCETRYYAGNFKPYLQQRPDNYIVKCSDGYVKVTDDDSIYATIEDAICGCSIDTELGDAKITGNFYIMAMSKYSRLDGENSGGMFWGYKLNGNEIRYSTLKVDCWIDFDGPHVFCYDIEHKQAFISKSDAAKSVKVVVHKLNIDHQPLVQPLDILSVNTRFGTAKLSESVTFTRYGKTYSYEVYDEQDNYLGDVAQGTFHQIVTDIENLLKSN